MLMVRTIKLIALTAVILIGLAGVAAYYATNHAHSAHHSDGALYALTWVFVGLGIVTSTTLIGTAVAGPAFGQSYFMRMLFEQFLKTLIIGGGITAFLGCFIASYGNVSHIDGTAYVCLLVGALGGLIGGFLSQVLLHANSTWIGEQRSSQSNLSFIRRAS